MDRDVSSPLGGQTFAIRGHRWRGLLARAALAVIALAVLGVADGPGADAAPDPAMQVWISPNNASADLLDLFKTPQRWASARARIGVLKLGPRQLCCTGSSGINNFTDLANAEAFRKLESWGIRLAVEAPAIKEWDCTGRNAAAYTLKLIKAVKGAGGAIRIVSTDGPLRSGTRPCGDSLEDTAAKTAAYVRDLKAYDPSLEIGDIEAYPNDTPKRLQQWITELMKQGYKPAHFHLDVNVHFLDVHPEINLVADLKEIREFLRAHQIPFGIIFWSGYDPEPSDRDYFQRTMAWVERASSAIGRPDEAVFQSWVVRSYPGCADTDNECGPPRLKCPAADKSGCGLKSVPINLPDNDPNVYSLTRLVNEAVIVLQSQQR